MPKFFDTRSFFDKTKPATLLQKKTRRALSKYGAYVRRSAQFSMKDRKASSQPGEAPSAHEKMLKRFIFFEYSEAKESVVIGPVRFGRNAEKHIPLLQEVGGVREVKTNSGRMATLNYAKHPYMQPAMKANQGVIAAAYSGTI